MGYINQVNIYIIFSLFILKYVSSEHPQENVRIKKIHKKHYLICELLVYPVAIARHGTYIRW